ncbi:MAG: ABC transporter ATP-binding protein [Treponema sp.]
MTEKELKKQVTGKTGLPAVLLALKIIFDLLPNAVVVYIIGQLIAGGERSGLKSAFAVMFASFALKGVCNYFGVRISHKRAYKTLTELRLSIIGRLKKLPLGFFKEHTTGALSNIVQHDVEQAEFYLAHGLPEIMSAVLIPSIIFAAMLAVDFRLAFAMLIGLPLMFAVMRISKGAMEAGLQRYFAHEMQMREELMEYVKNIAVVKAFAKEEAISARTLKTAREYIGLVKKSMNTVSVPMALIDVFMESGVVAVIIGGSVLLANGGIGIPRFILAVMLSAAFTAAIGKTAVLQHYYAVFNEALKAAGTVLCAELPHTQAKTADSLEAGDIELRNVSFAYQKDGFTIRNANMTVKQNTATAIVGSSGSGKSTLAYLLMGFWEASDGGIFIGGKNIADYSEEAVARLIGSVQQETILFDMSIADNIAIGKPHASLQEVIAAAKKARCHDFIASLPDGYDTRVGEMGARLSGGEKQRISIARTFLKDAPILILDEAMAAVDSENEKLIGEAIDDLRKNKTVITIAHHLNTIRNADQIVVMDKGCILDAGTHEELIKRCVFYRNMVEAQNKADNWQVV